MEPETITVRCTCGWQTSGATDDVVVQTRSHGRDLHNMEPSREEVLAMAAAAEEE